MFLLVLKKIMIDILYFKLDIGEPRETSSFPKERRRLDEMDKRISIFLKKWNTELDKTGPPLHRM